MKVIRLTEEQVAYVYEVSMKVDFPDNERKPLEMILDSMRQGKYDCLGLVEGEEILGYTLFFRQGDNCLFDYFAMLSKNRNQGLGSEFLRHIVAYYGDKKHVIGEVEDPDCAENALDAKLQSRRLNFYLRNGYEDTGAKANLFGVKYRILRMKNENTYTQEEIEKLYLAIYKDMLPKHMFERNVAIR